MEYGIEDLRKAYASESVKHGLPAFDELTRYFDLDSIKEEPLSVVRAVRRAMSYKNSSYVHLLETLLFPMNAPPMTLQIVQGFSTEDRKLVERVYETLLSIELTSLQLEIAYDAQAESQAVKEFFASWKEHRESLHSIVALMKKHMHTRTAIRDKAYLG